MRKIVLAGLMMLLVLPAYAGIEVHTFSSPEKEERYKDLINELRCLVCQNQNLSASDAPLAKQLREQAFTMVEKDASDDEIIDFMVTRYGDFVLYKPPLKPSTYALWIGPFILLFGGMIVLHRIIRRNRAVKATINEADYAKARKLLENEDNKA